MIGGCLSEQIVAVLFNPSPDLKERIVNILSLSYLCALYEFDLEKKGSNFSDFTYPTLDEIPLRRLMRQFPVYSRESNYIEKSSRRLRLRIPFCFFLRAALPLHRCDLCQKTYKSRYTLPVATLTNTELSNNE